MKFVQDETKYVGATEAMDFLAKKHPKFVSPRNELFTFARHHGSPNVVYIVVAEIDRYLAATACRWAGRHGMSDATFDHLQKAVAKEARTA